MVCLDLSVLMSNTQMGNTALHFAAAKGHAEVAKQLLFMNANVALSTQVSECECECEWVGVKQVCASVMCVRVRERTWHCVRARTPRSCFFRCCRATVERKTS
jgi:hypothetical protein